MGEVEGSYWSGKLDKLHNVAGKRPCFIGKDVLDLTKLLIYIRCLRLHREVLIRIIHVDVHTHEASLPKLYDFQSYNQ